MKNWFSYIILLISLSFYILLWNVLHPWLGYMLDSDCVAYLTIAKRVANGQYFESINGLWSPLNVWVLVPFIKMGYDAFYIAKLFNALFAGIILIQSFFLFKKFNFSKLALTMSMFALSIILSFFAYYQLFGDVMQLVFALFYIMLVIRPSFKKSYAQVALSGLVMGVAFYAKAYSLLFFFLHLLVILGWHIYKKRIEIKQGIYQYIIGVFCAILVVLPWTFALHQKYHQCTLTGFAGKLNMSWYINSGKTFKEDINLLIPPTYADSPSFWEDPYLSQGQLISPTSSVAHFVKWIARVVHTSLVSITCFTEISFLALAFLLIGIYYFFFRKKEKDEENESYEILVWTICLLPLGYLMMHIETRYIWLNTFLLIILAVKLIELNASVFTKKWMYSLALIISIGSFIIFPIIQFEQLKYKNKNLFELADNLKLNKIKGKFTSNITDAGQLWVVAYLTGSQFYTIEKTDYTIDELKKEIIRYNVDYYFLNTENNKFNLDMSDSIFSPTIKIGDYSIFSIRKDKIMRGL